MDELVKVERVGGALTLTIAREERRNALNDTALLQLEEALRSAAQEEQLPIVITGAGLKAFSAGSDIKELATQDNRARLAHTRLGQRVMEQIEEHPCPVVAAVEGYCLGGGLELAAACDLRICGEDATFGLPEVSINALPAWGGTFRVSRAVGVSRAKEMVLFGRRLTAAEALAWGLVAEIVPTGSALARALQIVGELSAAKNFDAFALAKTLVNEGFAQPPHTARQLEHLADAVQTASEAFTAGITAFGRSEAQQLEA